MVGINDSCTYSLDQELSASVKKIFLQQIAFKDAQIPDDGDILNHKYKPLNGRYNLQQAHGNPSKSNQVSNGSSIQNDIPKPPTQIYPVEKLELEWKEMRRIGPGLANLGNTCFLNSVLQVLTYTPPLVNYMLSGYHKSKCRTVGFCMQCELASHINRVKHHNTQMGAIRPMSIIQKLQCIGKNFRFGRQEDAHEFLRYVVEGIQKSDYADKPKLDKLSKETTVANAIFGGFYRSQVKCLHCNYESNTFDPMMDLNMDIRDCSSIIQTLHKSVRPDRLDGENKYFCEKCRTKRVAQKRGNIHKEPNVLTLVLKRFDFSKMFGGKISKEVAFSEELNIRPFMSNTQGEPVFYKLYGILVHSGYSCNSGHYYCYVKASNGTWYEMNDSRVCQVGLQTVLHAQAYMLFYVKSNQGKRLTNNHSPFPNNGVVKSFVQRPVPKPSGPSPSDKKQPINDTKDPLGFILKRKPEPKINWTHNQKQNVAAGKSQSMLNIPSNIKNAGESYVNGNKEKPVHPKKENDEKVLVHNTQKEEKKPLKGTTMNGLQKLSESYCDSDGGGSQAPSPKQMDEVNQNEKDADKNKENNDFVDKENNANKNGMPESKPPFKLKLKNGKQFIHNKLNIWSPITKGTLYPRAILNKCILDNESDQSKNHFSAKKKKLEDSSWKEENISTTEKLFGPLMPPPPGTKCQGNNSVTSEASSTGSIQTRSGDWDVLDKGCEPSPVKVPDPQPTGWNVSPTSVSVNKSEVMTTNDTDDSIKLKKKMKKKKRKQHSEEICISIDKGGAKNESIHNDKLEKTDRHDSKKKKVQLKSTISLPLIPALSDTEETPSKKKKKKKRKYSLLIDASSNNIGQLYTIPCSIEKYLTKCKVKNKSEIITNNGYKNIMSKVVKSTDSPSLIKSSSPHSAIEKDKIYEKSFFPNKQDSIKSSRETSTQQRILEHNLDNSKNNSPLLQMEDRPSAFNNCGSNPTPNISSVSPIVNRYCESNPRLQETIEHDDAFNNTSIKSHSLSPKRQDGSQVMKTIIIKDENNIPRKKEVPTHVWDDVKKKHFSWDGSSKSDTMEHLLGGGPKVKSWDGNNKSYLYNIKKHAESGQDEWDEEYDKGKVKKKRKIDDDYDHHKSKSNSFQDFQNYRNHNKDNKHSHRSTKHNYADNRHHSKKRKIYSEGSRFA